MAELSKAESGSVDHSLNLDDILQRVRPACHTAKVHADGESDEAIVDLAVRENVRNSIEQLKGASIMLSQRTEAGEVRICGAVYDLQSGAVEFLES